MPTRRVLITFLSVAETGSVTASAGDLGYSMAAVSQHVGALAQHLGVRLFAGGALDPPRGGGGVPPPGRGVTLTPEGACLVPLARVVLHAWQEITTLSAAFKVRETIAHRSGRSA